MGPTPCYLQSQVVSACQSFRLAVPFFFLAKVSFLAFLNTERCVAILVCLRCSPGDTDLNTYGFVGQASFFPGKSTIFGFFKYKKVFGHIDMHMTFNW